MTFKLVCLDPVRINQLYTGKVRNDLKLQIKLPGHVGNDVQIRFIHTNIPSPPVCEYTKSFLPTPSRDI